ncbi:MAG: DNA repair protein RecO [Dehalococcoidia bacterium]|nr:DNA repair protein RecO [Dehalococcoidia bacterium]
MGRPRSFQCQGLVLKSMSLGEAGLMATLYTPDMGKLKAMVRGARKPTSKMVGHLEPLNLVHLSLAASRPGGIDTVTQVQTLDSHSRLKADLESISRAIYVAELADGFGAEGSPNTDLYNLLLETVGTLQGDTDPELTLRYFDLHILKCSGFMPELYGCVDCRRDLEAGRHRFSPEAGGALCFDCTPAGPRVMGLSLRAMKVLRFIDHRRLPELAQLRIDPELRRELKDLLDASLKYWLDREIRSRRFLEHLERPPRLGAARGA